MTDNVSFAGDRIRIEEREDGTTITFDAVGTGRVCGDCQLCCKLLSVRELEKPALTRCAHQYRHGCRIYATRPLSCRTYTCRWLSDPMTAGMKRPDRAHYVIDLMRTPLSIEMDGSVSVFDAVQVWIDPAFPAVARDPALRTYIAKVADLLRVPTLLRFGDLRARAVFAPSLTADGRWHDQDSHVRREADPPGG